jgi:hypothetical protein
MQSTAAWLSRRSSCAHDGRCFDDGAQQSCRNINTPRGDARARTFNNCANIGCMVSGIGGRTPSTQIACLN